MRGPRRTGRFVPCLSALSYAGCGLFLILRRALGLHLVRDEHAITAKLAFDHGLRAVNECIWRGIVADVFYGEGFYFLRLLVLLADHEINALAFAQDGSRHHVTGHLQAASVGLVL